MTEEMTKTTETPLDPRGQANNQAKLEKSTRRVLVLSSVFLAITILDSFFQFRDFGAWQILADAGGILIALVFLLVSLAMIRQGRTDQAYNLIPYTILFGYAPGDLFLDGVTLYNLASGVLLFALAYFLLKPRNLPHWLRMLVLYIALVFVFSVFDLPRFDIAQSPSWQVSLPVFTAVLAIILGWQITRSIQIKTIQSRLLIILISLGFIPTLIATIFSTSIGFQRDLDQAENFLQAVSKLKNEQIATWYNQVDQDVILLLENPDFTQQIDFLVNYKALESFRNDIITDLRTEMQNLQIQTGRFTEISVLSTNGEVLVSTQANLEGLSIGEQDNAGKQIGNQNYFIFGKNENYRTPLVINRYTGNPEMQIYQPISGKDGEVLAVILGSLNTDNIIQTVSEATQLGETGEAYLVSIYNRLLTPLNNSPEVIPGSASNVSSPAIAETIQTQGSRTLRADDFRNRAVIGTYSWNPNLQTVLVVEQAESEAFQSLRLNIIINTAIGITTLAITITIAFFTARNFSEPIKSLSNEASKIWQGELTQIETLDRIDEIGELSQTLSRMTGQLLQTTTNLEVTVAERTRVLERRAKYLETTSRISRALTSIYEIDNLLNTVTHLISENFGFYHVGVFILDETQEYAVLRAANSEGGWKMLAREHKLRVGEQGIVGYVTGSGQPRIQQQVAGEDSVHFKNPDLPLTKSEMALVLKAGDTILGALDVQSTEEQAFTEEDINVLQVLADSVAVAIQNTRLVQQLQQRLETERKIYGEMTKGAWTSLLSKQTITPAFRSDGSGTNSTTAPVTLTGKQAMLQGKTVIADPDGNDFIPIAVPVKVRGGVAVAVIETHKHKSNGGWTKEEITVLESVGEDLGIALENARLVEETQRKAQRDRIAAELASKIWASSDVENILQTAVKELGSALQVSRGTIQLTVPDNSDQSPKTDGANQP